MNFLKVSPELVASVYFIEQFFGEYLETFRKHLEFRVMMENLIGKVYLDGATVDGKAGYLLIAALIHVQQMQFGGDGNKPISYHNMVAFDKENPTALQPRLEDLDLAAKSKFNKKFVELFEDEQEEIISDVAGRDSFSLQDYLAGILPNL